MKDWIYTLFVVLLGLPTLGAFADPPLANRVPDDDITSLVLAKLKSGGEDAMVAIRIPAWKQATRDETYQVQVPVQEEVTVEKVRDGKKELVTEAVMKVVLETRMRTVVVFAPKEPVKGDVPLADLQGWNLDGQRLTATELEQMLAKPKYLFCLSQAPLPGSPPLDPFYARALRPDMILVYSPGIVELFKQAIEVPPDPSGDDPFVPSEEDPFGG